MPVLNEKYTILDFLQTPSGQKVKTVLLGNGFCLDHPILGECFRMDKDKIFSLVGKIGLYLGKREVQNLRNLQCPEEFLNIFRWTITKETILSYAESLESKLQEYLKNGIVRYQNVYQAYNVMQKGHNANKILAKMTNIFTINYDPLIYFELLPLINNNCRIVDGFKGRDKISSQVIIERLQSNSGTKLYYLHGADFIILDKECKAFYKLNPDEICPEKILYNKNSSSNEVPSLIFESRWFIKKALIERNNYLSHCREQLINSCGDMLIFGVSLKNDAHIVEMLLEYADINHKKGIERKIYISYLENELNLSMHITKHQPKRLINSIIENELKEYYEIKQEYPSLRCKQNLLKDMIEEIPIKEEEKISNVFWVRSN